jgi:integrase
MRTLPRNQRAIDAAKYEGDGMLPDRIRIDDTDGLLLELSPTGHRVWRVYATNKTTGRRAWKTIGKARNITVSAAVERAKEFVGQAELGELPATAQPDNFETLFRDWVEKYGKVHKRSWPADVALFERHVASRLGSEAAAKIDRQRVISVLDDVSKAASGPQANACQSLISAVFSWAVDEGRLASHPAMRIRKRGAAAPRHRMLTNPEIKAIWQGTVKLGADTRTVVRLLMLLGQRRSEVAEMELRELDLDAGNLTIRAGRRKGWRIGTKKIPHVVPLPRASATLLREAVENARKSQFVFPNRTISNDRPMSADNVTSKFAALVRQLKIEDVRLHDLRHTAKTLMVRNGVSRFVADCVQDHKGVGNAGDIYDEHDYLNEKREALDVLETAMMKIVS